MPSDFDVVEKVRELVLTLVPMILSLSVHEFAHAFTAHTLGDDTAKESGRLTLNPVAHVDPWGTLLIPAMSVLAGGVAFLGWARPTPFRASRMRPNVNRRLGSALVSAAGPLSNLLLALLSALILSALVHAHVPVTRVDELTGEPGQLTPVGLLLVAAIQLNVALAIFNLLPFPPLDGARLLPPAFDRLIVPLERFGFLILVVLMMTGALGAIVGPPIRWMNVAILRLVGF